MLWWSLKIFTIVYTSLMHSSEIIKLLKNTHSIQANAVYHASSIVSKSSGT